MAVEKLYTKSQGRKVAVGYIEGDTFTKVVKRVKHLYMKTMSWGIDHEILKYKVEGRCRYICVYDTDNDENFWTTPEFWLHNGAMMDFGFGLQCFLPLTEFKASKKMLKVQDTLDLFDTNGESG